MGRDSYRRARVKPVLVDLELIEPGSQPMLVTSSDQQHAFDLPAAVTPQGELVSRWRFTEAERRVIAAGADLYVFMHTGGRPVQPIGLVVGPEGGPVLEPEIPREDAEAR